MNRFREVIKKYLDERANTDALFAKSYAKEGKTIDGCCNFIISEVRKLKSPAMTDDEVYSLAVHYYDEDSIADVKPIPCTVIVPGDAAELSEEERKQAHEEAKKIYAERLADKISRERKAKEQKARERALKRQKEEPQQLTLF